MNRTEAIEIVKSLKSDIEREIKSDQGFGKSPNALEALSILLTAAEASVAVMPEDENIKSAICCVPILDMLTNRQVGAIIDIFKSFPHIVLPSAIEGAKRYGEIEEEVDKEMDYEKMKAMNLPPAYHLRQAIRTIETMSRFLAEFLSGKPKEEKG
jgi:hypothetical protein